MKIYKIAEKTQLRMTEGVFHGKDRIDIRKYYYSGEHFTPDGSGDTFSPTPKGISLTREEATIVRDWLNELFPPGAKL